MTYHNHLSEERRSVNTHRHATYHLFDYLLGFHRVSAISKGLMERLAQGRYLTTEQRHGTERTDFF